MGVGLKASMQHPVYSRWTWGREWLADGTRTWYVCLGRLVLRFSVGV